MKLTVQTSDLAAALARLKPIAAAKSSLPILNSVLLRAADGKLALSATDLDIHLTINVPAEIAEDGATVVSCSRLAAAVSKIEGDSLKLTTGDKSGLSGVAADMRFRLLHFAPEEFPPAPTDAGLGYRVPLAEGALAAAIARVLPCVIEDETRYVLNGAFFTVQDEKLTIVATDGRRLTLTQIEAELESSGLAAIVPTKALKLLTCLDGGGATRLDFAPQYVSAEGTGWSLIAKLIEGNYPNWQQGIPPPGAKHRITVDRKALLDALPFVETVCTKGSLSVRLEAGSKQLTISASGPEIGETSADLPATIKGGELKVGFNPAFLGDALRAVDGAEVVLAMADEMSPLRIDEAGTIAVLLPMRLG